MQDRVERALTQKEKLRQEKAVQSLTKITKVARAIEKDIAEGIKGHFYF